MPVSIRLSRIGTKSKPFFRVVVVDSRKKRDGECIENIGTYNTLNAQFITFKPERYDAWVAQGAQPSDSAAKLYRQYKKSSVAVAAPVQEVKVVKKRAPKSAPAAE